MFEHRSHPLLPTRRFLARVWWTALGAFGVVFVAMLIGVLGYRHFEGLGWIDAILNASMILFGMGPVAPLTTTGGKLFASGYAMFAGLVFLTVSGLLFAPLCHRLLHRFHLEVGEDGGGGDSTGGAGTPK